MHMEFHQNYNPTLYTPYPHMHALPKAVKGPIVARKFPCRKALDAYLSL